VAEVKKQPLTNFIKFLGTAGARFVMIQQLRASGGIWISCNGTNVLVDPGPGSLVRCINSRPKLNPARLDGIILTHRHLDHAADVNVMIEAMTEGGFKKRGVVFCPQDALAHDPVIFKYNRAFPERIEILKPGQRYRVGNLRFVTSMQHVHPVVTFGMRFKINDTSVSLLTDTKYFERLKDFYKTDIVIMAVVFLEPRQGIDHLSLQEARNLIKELPAKKIILTHFGMTMLSAKPHLLAQNLSAQLGVEVVAAYDGMTLFP